IGLQGSPAYAAGACRDRHYVLNGWDATVCTNQEYTFSNRIDATGVIYKHPSNCGVYRVYVVDYYGGDRLLRSTAAKSCNVQAATTDFVYWSEFVKDGNGDFAQGYARLVAWD